MYCSTSASTTRYGSSPFELPKGIRTNRLSLLQRPFEGSTHSALATQITNAKPKFPVTDPPVSMPCLHAISSFLEGDPTKRIGSASFHSFTDNPFFRAIDFEAMERKEVMPVFVPSAEKTNFDATYDLEELLLEEAPLEARARRQKPREVLKDDATEKEIREEELYKMIEAQFTAFDYTRAAYESRTSSIERILTITRMVRLADSSDPGVQSTALGDRSQHPPVPQTQEITPTGFTSKQSKTRLRSKSKSSKSHSQASSYSNSPPAIPSHLVHQLPQPGQQASQPPYQTSGSRKESVGGGMQIVLGETGSWSDLAKNDTTLPADAKLVAAPKPTGMLSFLGRRKGRGNSPKPQQRGILGKEGARVVISSGE